MKYLISGGSGLVGKVLTDKILAQHEQVNWLTSSKKAQIGVNCFSWDIEKNEIDSNCLEGVDAIIHLAGAGVADKNWTDSRKKELIDSRIKSTQLLFDAVKNLTTKPKVIVAASAIGIYKNQNDLLLHEESELGTDFLATLTKDWENAVNQFESIGIRLVKLRIGIVLSATGGYLLKLAAPAKWGFASALGNGKMITSWIHIDDLANLFLYAALNENLNGVYNAVASNPVTNYEITKQIAKSLNRPFFMPNVPAFALKLIFGEMAAVILMSQNISASKTLNTGFKFKYETVAQALKQIYSK
ncbi:MAG: TIGR01777 family oxidoreductase [Bacteroidia bacterium]|nr:TIGR01777 family oxidoreductase [Bacteroidia bacterium]